MSRIFDEPGRNENQQPPMTLLTLSEEPVILPPMLRLTAQTPFCPGNRPHRLKHPRQVMNPRTRGGCADGAVAPGLAESGTRRGLSAGVRVVSVRQSWQTGSLSDIIVPIFERPAFVSIL